MNIITREIPKGLVIDEAGRRLIVPFENMNLLLGWLVDETSGLAEFVNAGRRRQASWSKDGRSRRRPKTRARSAARKTRSVKRAVTTAVRRNSKSTGG